MATFVDFEGRRRCDTCMTGAGAFKVVHLTEQAAIDTARRLRAIGHVVQAYEGDDCDFWHLRSADSQ